MRLRKAASLQVNVKGAGYAGNASAVLAIGVWLVVLMAFCTLRYTANSECRTHDLGDFLHCRSSNECICNGNSDDADSPTCVSCSSPRAQLEYEQRHGAPMPDERSYGPHLAWTMSNLCLFSMWMFFWIGRIIFKRRDE